MLSRPLRLARRRLLGVAAVAGVLLSSLVVPGAASADSATTATTTAAAAEVTPRQSLTVVSPVRLLDTRSGVGAARRAVPAGGRITVQIAGRGGIPTGAAGAVLNLTVTNTARAGYLQVVPHAAAAGTSTVNYAAGQTAANAVFTALSTSGQVDIINRSTGTADIIAETSGYLPAAPDQAGITIVSPARLLDTRSGVGAARRAVPAGGRITVQIAGRGGIPTGAAGAVLNLTVTNTARAGYLQVVPHAAAAGTSTVNYAAGQTAANAVFTALSTSGQVDIINRSTGTADIIADTSAAGQSPDEFPSIHGRNGNNANPGPVGITAATAGKLVPTWKFSSDFLVPEAFGLGMVFDSIPAAGFGATDTTTGRSRWISNPPATFRDGSESFKASLRLCRSLFDSGILFYSCTVDPIVPRAGEPPLQVLAYDALTGKLLWQSTSVRSVASQEYYEPPGPMAYADGRLYVVSSTFDAFDAATGARIWVTDSAAPGSTYPPVSDVDTYEGKLYLSVLLGAGNGFIDVWDGATPTRLWSYPARPLDPNYYRVIVADGHVFVPDDPWLIAFDAGGCGAKICGPQWKTDVRVANQTGNMTFTPELRLGAVVNGRIFVTASDGLSEAPGGGASNDFLVALNNSTGAISAYWSTPEAMHDAPVAAGGLIWTSSRGFAEAFPQNCTSVCAPLTTTIALTTTNFEPIRISGTSLLAGGQAYQPH